MTPTETQLTLNGLKVNFWEDGQNNNRTLLLIHGGIGDAHLHWSAAIPLLAHEFRVIAPDLPGFGKSDPLPNPTTTDLLSWLRLLLDNRKIDQAVIVGNSHGGLIARLYAAGNPTAVPALILVNGGGVPDVPPALRFIERVPGLSQAFFYLFGRMGTGKGMVERLLHNRSFVDETFLATMKNAGPSLARHMRMTVSSPMPQERNPMVPTLILWGANDSFAPLSEGKAVRDSIPGSELVEIAECGHMPQLETPDVFVWQIETFLEKLSRPSSSKREAAKILRTPPS